jgi:hypothetical protein
MTDRYDPLTPAQRAETERLVALANAEHKRRCEAAGRIEIPALQDRLADEIRAAYAEGLKAKDEPTE